MAITYRYSKPKPLPERKVDVFAGEGSIAGNLKKRRESIESGDPSGGRNVVGGDNSADEVIQRGYFKENDE